MIRLHRIPYRLGGPARPPEELLPVSFLVDPSQVVLIEKPHETVSGFYPEAKAHIQTTAPNCEGIMVQEDSDQIAMLIAGWKHEQRLKGTSNSQELPLYVHLDPSGCYARVEKVMAR